MNTSRKEFLKTITAGSSLSALSFFTPVDSFFKEDLRTTFKDGSLPQKSDYSIGQDISYLNHGSIGTIPKIVQEAHRDYLEMCETNPWFYMWSGEWEEPREKVREKVAKYINADASEISFPHNTTEIFNLLALGLPLGTGDEVVFCNFNHAGAAIPFQVHSKIRGYDVKMFDIPSDNLPSITKEDILKLYDDNITSKTKLVVMPHIDNTFGIRQPVKEITALARSRGVRYVALDTAQTMGMIPIDVKELDIDVIGTSAHKWIQTPKGVSIAYFSKRIQDQINPMWVTWGQERWKDSARKFEDYGTRNLLEVLTLGHSVDFQSAIDEDAKATHLKGLWSYAKKLVDQNPNTSWRSPGSWDLSGSLFVIGLKDSKPSEIAHLLFTELGYVVRPFDDFSTIRISPNIFNTKEEIIGLIQAI